MKCKLKNTLEMDAQIETANANRSVAVAQFNAGEANAVESV